MERLLFLSRTYKHSSQILLRYHLDLLYGIHTRSFGPLDPLQRLLSQNGKHTCMHAHMHVRKQTGFPRWATPDSTLAKPLLASSSGDTYPAGSSGAAALAPRGPAGASPCAGNMPARGGRHWCWSHTRSPPPSPPASSVVTRRDRDT